MKLFAQTDIAKAFQHKDREPILKYIELICNRNSEMNQIENLEERKKAAKAKAKWTGVEDEQTNELIFHYLSYYQGNNDFSLLLSREEVFAQMLKAVREPIVNILDEDKYLKAIKIKGEIDNLLEQLGTRIKTLRTQLYGVHEEIAVSKIKKVLTPETRLLKVNGEEPKV